ncbi:MAG: PH domain-containing protein [Deltaproteobacteria bacterium]|nr:PH domain-containing protein [Deltaproteobacteria bacterium]
MTSASSPSGQDASFEETQRFRQWWVVALLALVFVAEVGVFGYGLYRQLVVGQPFGDKPMSDNGLIFVSAIVIPFTTLLVFGVLAMRLTVRVEADGLAVRFWPFVRRRIPWSEVRGFRAVQYRPVREYGGWGIRGMGKNKAYNVSGDRGVRLLLDGGKKLLLGSQRAEALEAAIAKAAGREPGGVD